MITLCLIAGGGFLGATARYFLTEKIKGKKQTAFPFATMMINLSGAFLLGVVVEFPAQKPFYSFVGVGFMGAFTTFSTMMLEAFQLKNRNMRSWQFLYLFLSCVGGVSMTYLGMKAAHSFFIRFL